jgi:hypothetical protein
LAQNDVEWASNSSTATASDDSTSFSYGPAGNQIQNITAFVTRRVRFQTPFQIGDKLSVEVSEDRVKWYSLDTGAAIINSTGVHSFTVQGSQAYGIGRMNFVNSTDVDVGFGQTSQPTNADYNTAGASWSVGGGAGYWRVRKSSAGAAVGFGLANTTSSGLVGTGVQSFAGAKTFTTFPTFSTQSLVRVTDTSGQAVGDNVPTKISFGTETYDTTNEWSTATNRFTASNAGYYRVSCALRLTTIDTWNVGEAFSISLYVNGTRICELGVTECWASGGVTNGVHCFGSTTINLSASDYIEIYATQDRGGSSSLSTSAGKNWLCIERIA